MPRADDGYEIHRLVSSSPPLDVNSIYSYYLLCEHFSETCVVAEHENSIGGFLSAYRIPKRSDTLFIWQVAVSEALRGRRIASCMLEELLSRFVNDAVHFVESTVNPGNIASRGLFERLARQRGSALHEQTFLDVAAFGTETEHESEILLRIPLQTQNEELPGEHYANI
jgi:L-2,4-diaminobutyric acid acetyltransferase